MTPDKLVALVGTAALFTIYTIAFGRHLDAILFDRRLAEAEGVNTKLHVVVLLLVASAAISVMLRVVGGFLVFTLLYVPTVAASALGLGTHHQRALVAVLGPLAAAGGLCASLALDLPVGVSIALTTVASAAAAVVIRHLLGGGAGRSLAEYSESGDLG